MVKVIINSPFVQAVEEVPIPNDMVLTEAQKLQQQNAPTHRCGWSWIWDQNKQWTEQVRCNACGVVQTRTPMKKDRSQ